MWVFNVWSEFPLTITIFTLAFLYDSSGVSSPSILHQDYLGLFLHDQKPVTYPPSHYVGCRLCLCTQASHGLFVQARASKQVCTTFYTQWSQSFKQASVQCAVYTVQLCIVVSIFYSGLNHFSKQVYTSLWNVVSVFHSGLTSWKQACTIVVHAFVCMIIQALSYLHDLT